MYFNGHVAIHQRFSVFLNEYSILYGFYGVFCVRTLKSESQPGYSVHGIHDSKSFRSQAKLVQHSTAVGSKKVPCEDTVLLVSITLALKNSLR